MMLVSGPILETASTPRYVGSGCFGDVYRVSDEHCVKVNNLETALVAPFESMISRFGIGFNPIDLRNELRIQQELYAAGIPVPEPLGLVRANVPVIPSLPWTPKRSTKGILMQYIDGKTLESIKQAEGEDSLLYRGYKVALERMIDEARDKGFTPDDACDQNCIVDMKQGKTYLIDFQFWRNG